MFDQLAGLPVHPLVVHAVVVFVPLAVVAALAYAFVSRWRWALRWPTVALAAASAVTALAAVLSGDAFFDRLGQPEFVVEHRSRGILLAYLVGGFFVAVVAAAYALGGPTRLVGGRDRAGASGPVRTVVVVLLVVLAIACGVQVVRTGDAGTRAVYGASVAGAGAVGSDPGGSLDSSNLR